MRTQAHGVHFLLPLVVNVSVQHLLGENIAFEQELIVPRERVQRVFQGSRHGWNLRQFLWTQIVDVLVERLTWIDLILDTIESCHEHRSEREIRTVSYTHLRAHETVLDLVCR